MKLTLEQQHIDSVLHYMDEYPRSGQNREGAAIIRQLLSAATLVAAENDAPFSIEAKPDGVWLKFKDGAVCLNAIADERGPIVRRAMNAAIAAAKLPASGRKS